MKCQHCGHDLKPAVFRDYAYCGNPRCEEREIRKVRKEQ